MKIKPLKIGSLCAEVPVIQGGMGIGISLSGLAGAVAAGGGIGVISAAQIGFREPDFDKEPLEANLRALKREVRAAKDKAAGGIIGVNIMVAMRWYEEYVKAAVEAGADLIISGAGLPLELPALVRGSRVKIAPIVSSIKAASVICRMWDRKERRAPDLVIIEGPEAGGHLGFSYEQLDQEIQPDYDEEIKGIIACVKEYAGKYRQDIPVAMAGGIYTRADMEHYLALGVNAVQLGTRFVTTVECDADIAYKQAFIKARREDIQIIKSPVGMPGRAIRNGFLAACARQRSTPQLCHKCLRRCNPAEIPFCITDALINAARGNTEAALLFCGSNAWRAKRIETVEEVLQEFR